MVFELLKHYPITRLILCYVGGEIRTSKSWILKIANLTFYAVEIRYPEDCIELTIGEAEELHKIARKVRDFMRGKLKENGLRW